MDLAGYVWMISSFSVNTIIDLFVNNKFYSEMARHNNRSPNLAQLIKAKAKMTQQPGCRCRQPLKFVFRVLISAYLAKKTNATLCNIYFMMLR